jgi:Flp pilus assembly protein TadB
MEKANIYAYVGLGIIVLLALIIILLIFKKISEYKSDERKVKEIIVGNQDAVKISDANLDEKKRLEKSKKDKKLRKNAFYQVYVQYMFFGGTKGKLFASIFGGWGALFVIYLAVSYATGGVNVLAAIVLSPLYFVVFYMFMETSLKKKRLKYIKGFISSLGVMSSSISAGNSLETAIKTVSEREMVYKPVRDQFVILSNNITSGIPLSDALDSFMKRNYLFDEFTMFAIVIQFFVKAGGRNMKKIFDSLQKSLSQKQENYATIEGNIVSYTMAFDAFLVIELLASFICPFFLSGFYSKMTGSITGMLKGVGSVLMTVVAVYVFKGSIRTAAEG